MAAVHVGQAVCSLEGEFLEAVLRPPLSRGAEQLVCLQAEPPLRMVEAVAQGKRGVLTHRRAIHGLQVEALEVKIFEEVRHGTLLWEDQLQFVAVAQDERRSSLGADADPVEALGWVLRAVRLDRNL